jgi:thiol:disulfide interchange protein
MPGRPPKDEDKYEIFYTPSRIAKLANGVLIVLVLVLLVLPIYLLYHMVHDVGSHEAYLICIGLLFVFTLAFSSTLSLFTKAKRHEILAAAAAYCAVLVVFLGNVSPPDMTLNEISGVGPTVRM